MAKTIGYIGYETMALICFRIAWGYSVIIIIIFSFMLELTLNLYLVYSALESSERN